MGRGRVRNKDGPNRGNDHQCYQLVDGERRLTLVFAHEGCLDVVWSSLPHTNRFRVAVINTSRIFIEAVVPGNKSGKGQIRAIALFRFLWAQDLYWLASQLQCVYSNFKP